MMNDKIRVENDPIIHVNGGWSDDLVDYLKSITRFDVEVKEEDKVRLHYVTGTDARVYVYLRGSDGTDVRVGSCVPS